MRPPCLNPKSTNTLRINYHQSNRQNHRRHHHRSSVSRDAIITITSQATSNSSTTTSTTLPSDVVVSSSPSTSTSLPAAAILISDFNNGDADVVDTTSGDDGGSAVPPGNGGNHNNNDGGNDDDDDNFEPPPPSIFSDPVALLLRGIRGRLAADPFFVQKLLVECGLDATIIIGVNISARKDRFLPEIEFTACQLAVSLLSDFALVYLLAPSTLRSAAAAGSLRAKLEALPSHVFQSSPHLLGPAPFTPISRLSTFLVKALQYGGVGYVMGCVGAASVRGLIMVRQRFDPVFSPPEKVQSLVGTGLCWSAFMATSSNARYNVVNGLEEALYRRSGRVGTLGSVVLRLMNNWAGAAQWVAVTNRINLDVPWKTATIVS